MVNKPLNPNYRRLVAMNRKYFEYKGRNFAWLILIGLVAVFYLQESISLLTLLCIMPVLIFMVVAILTIETARLVSLDRQKPMFQMVLLTPLTARTIVEGYRQAAYQRLGRVFGLSPQYLLALLIISYTFLALNISILLAKSNRTPSSSTSGFQDDMSFDDQVFQKIIFLGFAIWLSLLFSSITYYWVMVDFNIGLGLRYKNIWFVGFLGTLFLGILFGLSSLIFGNLLAFAILQLQTTHQQDWLVLIVLFIPYHLSSLIWRHLATRRAIGIIRQSVLGK